MTIKMIPPLNSLVTKYPIYRSKLFSFEFSKTHYPTELTPSIKIEF